jgi:hypothetical protein
MIKNNRVSVSLSRFILVILIMVFTSSAMAEYYIVYPASAAPCCQTRHVYKKVYKRHYRNPCKRAYRRVYRSSPRIQKYYMYRSCCGAYWVPTCDTCGNFYVPPEYYYRSNYYYYDSYYYDPAIDWDTRTMDDY